MSAPVVSVTSIGSPGRSDRTWLRAHSLEANCSKHGSKPRFVRTTFRTDYDLPSGTVTSQTKDKGFLLLFKRYQH